MNWPHRLTGTISSSTMLPWPAIGHRKRNERHEFTHERIATGADVFTENYCLVPPTTASLICYGDLAHCGPFLEARRPWCRCP